MMKKLIIFIFSTIYLVGFSQEDKPKNKVNFELGSGLNFNFKDNYQFKISGMIQPSIAFQKLDTNKTETFLNVRRAYFNISGMGVREKVSFFLQTDFSQSNFLLDAWIAYQPFQQLKLTVGQKQNIANNREMLVMEDKLQFADRGLLSESFSATGRELGFFVETAFKIKKFEIRPQISVTTGDGRLTFGTRAETVNLGGLKYSARIDILPLGDFVEGNEDLIADLMHEQKFKMILGIAGSINDGVSNNVGEGQGNLILYNTEGTLKLPDYRQLYADALFKFRGFSLLGEFVVATASDIDGSFIDDGNNTALIPTQISEYLSLGTGLKVQLGYATKNGYALDVKYENSRPEFINNQNSIITNSNAIGANFSKYFKGNDLKLQASFLYTRLASVSNLFYGGISGQVVF